MKPIHISNPELKHGVKTNSIYNALFGLLYNRKYYLFNNHLIGRTNSLYIRNTISKIFLVLALLFTTAVFATPTDDLLDAALKGYLPKAEVAIKAGADVNGMTKYQEFSPNYASNNRFYSRVSAAIHFAAGEGHLEIVKLLLANKVDVNARTNDGHTSLIYASEYGHLEIAKLLIDNKADVNAKTEYNWTAVIIASWKGHLEIIKLLIANKADVNVKDVTGKTAFVSALENDKWSVISLLFPHNFQFLNPERKEEEIFLFFRFLSWTQRHSEKEQIEFCQYSHSVWEKEKSFQTDLHSTLIWFLYALAKSQKAEEKFSSTKVEHLGNIIYQKRNTNPLHANIDFLLSRFYSLHKDFEKADQYLSLAVEDAESFFTQLDNEKDFSYYQKVSLEKKKGVWYNTEQEKKKPKLLIQNGHTGSVNRIAYSPDGKTLATASSDNTAKIWSIDGKLLHTLEGHTELYYIAYSPDGKTLATASSDNTAKIWSIDGKLLHTLVGHTGEGNVTHIAYSPDGKTLATASRDNTAKIWSTDGKLLRTLQGHMHWVTHIAYSPDGKTLATASHDKTTKIWSIDGKLLHTLEGHTNEVNHIAYSPDGKTLTTAAGNSNNESSDNTAKIWSIDGKLLYTLEGHTSQVNYITYSPNGKTLATTAGNYFNNSDSTAKIWSTDGKLLHTLQGHALGVMPIYSPDGKTFANILWNKNAKIWSLDGKLLHTLIGHTNEINHITYSPDGNTLTTVSKDKTAKIWSIDGKLLHTLEGHTNEVNRIAYSPDGKTLTTASEDNTAKIWSIDGKLLHTLEGHTNRVDHITYSPDGKTLATASPDNTKIWSIDGKLLHTLEGNRITYSPDGKTLATASSDNTKIWSIDGKLLYSLEDYWADHIAYSPDGKTLATVSRDNTTKIWSIDGKLLHTLQGQYASYAGSPDGKYIMTGLWDNKVIVWDISQPDPVAIHKLKSHTNVIFSMNLLKDGKILATSSADGTIKYWDWKNGILLATQMFFNDSSSTVFTPEGYFDYSGKSALDYISFTSPHIQSGFLDLQDLMNDYHYDGLLESLLDNSFKPNKKNNLTKGVETTSVVKALFETQQSVVSNDDTKTLQFMLSERGSKLEKAVVYVNGIQVDEKTLVDGENTEGVVLEDDSKEGFFKYRVKFAIPLNFGNNRVEVKAYNAYNIPQSFPAFEIQRKIPENKELAKPDLYILSVGINDYKIKKLTYSVPDAKAMAEALQQGKSGIYHEVNTKLLVDAKKKEIVDALSEIEKKARPQDVVVIYFSGHGMNAFNREGKKLFYFVPQDFKWPDDPENENVARNQGIDADYLDETFTKIKSHKLILILDACHSGSVNTALASRGQDKERATRKAMEKMANGTGRFIFASSSGNEESREHSEVGHGLYTYVFLNALGNNKNKDITDADSINKDGFIYLSEIRSYIEQQFEDQTAKYLKGVIQTPPSMSLGRNGMHERVNDFPLLKAR